LPYQIVRPLLSKTLYKGKIFLDKKIFPKYKKIIYCAKVDNNSKMERD